MYIQFQQSTANGSTQGEKSCGALSGYVHVHMQCVTITKTHPHPTTNQKRLSSSPCVSLPGLAPWWRQVPPSDGDPTLSHCLTREGGRGGGGGGGGGGGREGGGREGGG